MEFIETTIFTRLVVKYLADEEYHFLQLELARDPEKGAKIPSSGGIRKLRWARQNEGKSGGFRIIYYWFSLEGKLLLLYIYPKNAQDNLTKEQLKILRQIVEGEE